MGSVNTSHDMGLHEEQLAGRTQQRFFSASEEENFTYPWAYEVDFDKSAEFDAADMEITDINKLEQPIFETEKMSSLGTLAGGLAHDFNNIMSILLGYINIHKSDSRLPKETSEAFVKMELATLNAVNISNQIFALVKEDHDTKLEIKNMNNIIETTTDFTLKGSSIMPIFQLQDERSIDT